MAGEVVDITHKLTYETNTNAIQDVNKAFEKQFQEIRDLEAEQIKLNALQSSTNSIKVTEQLNQKLAENKKRIDDITASIGKEFAANEKLAASTVKATKNLSNLSFAGSQLLREAPAFTYSIQTGILALSNNIPVLLDQLKNARAAGGTTKEIFSALGSSIFGLSGIITIAVSALTIFGDKIFGVGEKASKAAEDYQKFVDAISQNIGSTITAIDKQSNRANILFDVIQKGGKGAAGAIKELRDTYPSLFANLKDADILAGKGIDRLKEQIAINEKAKLAENELILFQKEKRKANEELAIAVDKNTAAQFRLTRAQVDFNSAIGERKDAAFNRVQQAEKDAKNAAAALNAAQRNVKNLSDEITKAQAAAANFISQAPDLAFKQGRGKSSSPKQKKEEEIKTLDADLAELFRMEAAIYDKYRVMALEDAFSGKTLTDAERATREKNMQDEIALIKNFIARRENALKQIITKDKEELLKLQIEAEKLQLEFVQLTGTMTSAPIRGKITSGDPVIQSDELTDKTLENIHKIIDAYSVLSQAVLSAFATINAAQIASLDKEIDVRQTRVEQATKLAEQGNAEILRLEQNRLDEALKAREEAAKKQQAINAALAVSEAIVAIATAASESGAGAIVIVPAVVAAIAAGYAAISSITREAEGFKEGVVDYQGKGTGKSDSNIVKISRGESVITAEATAKNRAILEMMNNGLVFNPHSTSTTNSNNVSTKGIEKRLDKVVEAVEGSHVVANQSLDAYGFSQTVETIQRRERNRRR